MKTITVHGRYNTSNQFEFRGISGDTGGSYDDHAVVTQALRLGGIISDDCMRWDIHDWDDHVWG